MNIYSMILEGIVAGLLLIAIGYCWKLDRSLKQLRTGRDGMLQAARELQQFRGPCPERRAGAAGVLGCRRPRPPGPDR